LKCHMPPPRAAGETRVHLEGFVQGERSGEVTRVKRLEIGGRVVELVHGDITEVEADAIGNAANSRLEGGGGVDGAIHRAGGPAIMKECRAIGGCPTGRAVVTTAGNLPAKHVIHAVGPVWRGGDRGEPELLRSAYLDTLKRADEVGAKTVALPSISTGVYGYPVDLAADVALRAVCDYLGGDTGIENVTFVLFRPDTMSAYEKALEELAREKR